MLLVDRRHSRRKIGSWRPRPGAHTEFHTLCSGGQDQAAGSPLMQTEAERLLEAGIATGLETFADFLSEIGWVRDRINRTICHQVGSAHRKRMLEALLLDPSRDFTSFERLGNTGSVALPITLALAAEQGVLAAGDQVSLLGIGSGINSVMMGLDWQHALVGTETAPAPAIAGAGD